jgi:hypothetical protein
MEDTANTIHAIGEWNPPHPAIWHEIEADIAFGDTWVSLGAAKVGKEGHLAQFWQWFTLPQTPPEKCRPSTGIDNEGGLYLLLVSLGPTYPHGDLVSVEVGLFDRVLFIHGRTCRRRVPEQQGIKICSYHVVGKRRVPSSICKGSATASTALKLVTERHPGLAQETSLADRLMASEPIKNG